MLASLAVSRLTLAPLSLSLHAHAYVPHASEALEHAHTDMACEMRAHTLAHSEWHARWHDMDTVMQ